MPVGAPGFSGRRLSDARRSQGLGQSDLAERVGVAKESVSKYENDHTKPTHDVVERLSGALGFPVSYFFADAHFEDSKPVFWRGQLTATKTSKERAAVRLEWFKHIIDYLGSFLDFKPLNLPETPRVSDFRSIDSVFIEETAQAIRSHWGIAPGPMPDVIERLELNGVLVARMTVEEEKLAAFSQWSDHYDIPFVVLSLDKASAVRQRFDALHELAHIVMHRSVAQTDLNNRAHYKRIEDQANKLASALLLPEKEFYDELYSVTLDGFLSMKDRWRASVGAMIMRSYELDVINDAQKKRLMTSYTRRGWRKGEPLDSSLPKEEPMMIRSGFEMLLEEGIQTVSDIRNALPFPIGAIEELADLPRGTLGTEPERRRPRLRVEQGSNVVSLFGD